MSVRKRLLFAVLAVLAAGCSDLSDSSSGVAPVPSQVIDLTATITTDQPVRIWGSKMLKDYGFRETNDFEFIITREPLYVSNAYWTLFNHTGAHLDAPSHMIEGAQTIDKMPLHQLIGRGRALDFRHKDPNEAITADEIKGMNIHPGEIVLLVVGYKPPTGKDELPAYAALSIEAANYLAELPVQAIGTDGFSVESVAHMYDAIERGIQGNEGITPNHNAFFMRNIPVYEALNNLDSLLGLEAFVFVGFPLKVVGSDGSPVRAAALVY
jgi:kynurenine formamidase